MDNKLARLFDYQKYEPNLRLGAIIDNVESRYELENNRMSDEELGMVSAAGSPIAEDREKEYKELFINYDTKT